MPRFFQPNLDQTGRLMRLGWGLLCLVLGLIVGTKVTWLAGGVLIGLAVFSFLEAARSWCILRACGIKTKY